MGKLLLWVATVFMLLSGIIFFPSIASILMLLTGILIIPLKQLGELRKKFIPSKALRGGIIAILVIASFLTVPTDDSISDVDSGNTEENISITETTDALSGQETTDSETDLPITDTQTPETDPPATDTQAPETDPPATETQAPETEPPAPETQAPETEPPKQETQPPETTPVKQMDRRERLDHVIEDIRRRFGKSIICNACLLNNPKMPLDCETKVIMPTGVPT